MLRPLSRSLIHRVHSGGHVSSWSSAVLEKGTSRPSGRCVCGNLCCTRYCLQAHQGRSTWPGATKFQMRCQDMRFDQPHVAAVFQQVLLKPSCQNQVLLIYSRSQKVGISPSSSYSNFLESTVFISFVLAKTACVFSPGFSRHGAWSEFPEGNPRCGVAKPCWLDFHDSSGSLWRTCLIGIIGYHGAGVIRTASSVDCSGTYSPPSSSSQQWTCLIGFICAFDHL